MVNCNPETVSTDYDTSDRLYFEPLTAEDVLEIIACRAGERHAARRHRAVRRPDAAEARQARWRRPASRSSAPRPTPSTSPRTATASSTCCDRLGLKQPTNGIAHSAEQSRAGRRTSSATRSSSAPPTCWAAAPWRSSATRRRSTATCSAPCPSWCPTTSRRAIPNDKTGQINTVLGKNPLLFDRYLSRRHRGGRRRLCDGKDVFVAGIMEHIEEAGIHSGDSACSLPPHSLTPETIAELERQTRELALALDVGGLMNVQFAIEGRRRSTCWRSTRAPPAPCPSSPRPSASRSPRSPPRIMAGETLGELRPAAPRRCDHIGGQGSGVPLRPLPRRRHPARPGDALHRRGHGPRPLASASPSPRASSAAAPSADVAARVFVSVRDADKPRIARARCSCWPTSASRSWRPRGTQRFLEDERRRTPPRSTRCWKAGRTSSTPSRTARSSSSSTPPRARRRLPDCRSLRRAALLHKVPYYTTLAGAVAAAQGIKAYQGGDLEVRALQDYFAGARLKHARRRTAVRGRSLTMVAGAVLGLGRGRAQDC